MSQAGTCGKPQLPELALCSIDALPYAPGGKFCHFYGMPLATEALFRRPTCEILEFDGIGFQSCNLSSVSQGLCHQLGRSFRCET